MLQKNSSSLLTPPESEMIPLISEFGKDFFPRRFPSIENINSVTEVNAGFGIADVVFFEFDQKTVSERISYPLEPIHSESIIKTLLLIKNKRKFSITYLANQLSMKEADLRSKIIRFLQEKNIISQKGNDYTVNFEYNIGLNHSIAVEAKIKDWQRGLYQAYRYKWFSEASYLALHENHIEQPKHNLALFKKLNVGLMSVGKEVDIIYNPKKEKPQSRYMQAVAFEKIFSKTR